MAANYWESHSAKNVVSRHRLADAHSEDKLRGLTDDQLQLITIHFCASIHELARACKLRQRVAATAIVYFRRFYLRNNFCTTDPRLVFAGCLYLASKAEESLLAAKHLVVYVKKIRPGWSYDVKHLLEVEMVLMEDLDFNLVVFSPYRALSALLKDSQVGIAQQAWAVLNDSYRTSVSLIHTPHVVALASIYVASLVCKKDIGPWLEGLNVALDQVFDAAVEILAMYENHKDTISVEDCNRLLEAVARVR